MSPAALSETELQQRLQNTLSETRSTPLSESQLQAFAAELNALKAEVMAEIGEADVTYVKNIHQLARICEINGRLLLHFSRDPVSWSLGVLSLWVYLQLDNLEIHHYAQHQVWDQLPEAAPFHSANYYHNSPVDEEAWRYRHNILHHSYTGQVERDPDVSFGLFRLSELIDRQYFHTIQPLLLILNTFNTGQSIGLISTGLPEFFNRLIPGYKADDHASMFKGQPTAAQFMEALWKYLRKAVPNAAYNFGLYGLLAGPRRWGQVTLGMLTAILIRDIFTGLSFYTGHMVEGVKHYEQAPRNRAEWYLQQIEGTANVRAGTLVSLLMGHLNYQIEHHLFPKMPPNRLEAVAPRVQAICERHGVQYLTGSFGEQIASVFRRMQNYTR